MTLTSNEEVLAFFKSYEKAIESNDPTSFGQIYHTSFLFGSPQGAQTIALDDFLKLIPHRAAFSQKLGLKSTHLGDINATTLDDKFVLAKVAWTMTIEPLEKETRTLETKATYILMRTENCLRIVSQIDHQDLLELLKTD